MSMQRFEFHAGALPTEGRLQAWNQNLSQFAVDIEGGGDSAFTGTIRTCVAPSGLSFTVLESEAPQRWCSSPGKVGDVFWLSLLLEGSAVLDLGAGPIAVSPGDILYGKRGVPSSQLNRAGFRLLLVNIPGEIVARKILLPLPNRAIHLSGQSGMGRILSGMLRAVADSIEELDETLTGPIEAALPQFLLSSLFGENADRIMGGATAIRASVLQRIWRAIEQGLDDADLSLGQIADAQGLSVRYVQKLFEESGQSFTTYVRRRRLEQCRSDLANPINVDISITSTCFRWGFNDAATFSRAFRGEFGLSPREYRRANAALPRQPGRPRRLQALT